MVWGLLNLVMYVGQGQMLADEVYVRLAWNASPSVVAGYRVLASREGGEGFTNAARIAGWSQTCECAVRKADLPSSSGTWWFAVVAVNAGGEVSDLSNLLSVERLNVRVAVDRAPRVAEGIDVAGWEPWAEWTKAVIVTNGAAGRFYKARLEIERE